VLLEFRHAHRVLPLKVIENGTVRSGTYDLLLVSLGLSPVRDKWRQLSKNYPQFNALLKVVP